MLVGIVELSGVCVCMYIYIYVCVCVCVYIYIYDLGIPGAKSFLNSPTVSVVPLRNRHHSSIRSIDSY